MTINKIFNYNKDLGYVETNNLNLNLLLQKIVKIDETVSVYFASDIDGMPEDFKSILKDTLVIVGEGLEVINNGTNEFESLRDYSGAKVLTAEMQYGRYSDQPEILEKCLKSFKEYYGGYNVIFIDTDFFSEEELKFVLLHEIGHILSFHLFGKKYLSDKNAASFIRSEASADLVALIFYAKLFNNSVEKSLNLYNKAVNTMLENIPVDADPEVIELQKRRFEKVNNFQNNTLAKNAEVLESYFN